MIKIELIVLDKNNKRDLKLSGSIEKWVLKVPAVPRVGDKFTILKGDLTLNVSGVYFEQVSKKNCAVVVFLKQLGGRA